MSRHLFNNIFHNLSVTVLVCRDDVPLTVAYENVSAHSLFNPYLQTQVHHTLEQTQPLCQVLRFEDQEEQDAFIRQLRENDVLMNFIATVITHDGTAMPVSISTSLIELESASYRLVYIYASQLGESTLESLAGVLSTAFHLAYNAPSTDEAINNILAFAGSQARVSRSYVFESVSATMTSNTYEWCAAGVEPAIEQLQNLPKDEYSYDDLIGRGLWVTDDIRLLSEEDRAVLEPQGIKSMAIIPIFSQNEPLGYVGFDDCEKNRKWSSAEIQVLHDITDILASLLVRRDMERSLSRSLSIMQTITDNTDNIIYANDMDTYELVFINKPLADSLGDTAENIMNRRCWQALQKDMTGPCPFGPLPRMTGADGSEPVSTYTWEFCNTITGKWYLVRDAIIKWIDGRDVHIETATEITHQKQYEEQLKQIASTDMLTGLYNREWGYKIINQALQSSGAAESSLVFADLDGLKHVNDTLGHEAGDNMLRKVAEVIQNSVRKSDAICRWGGDEFIFLLRCRPHQAEKVMQTIQDKFDQINKRGELPFRLSMSFGITALNAEMGIDAIISEADKLMYENKMAKRVARE